MTEPVEQYRADSIMAMNAFNRIAGGLANPLSGLGTMRDRTTSSSIVRGRVLSQGEINTLYYGDAFIQKAIDLVVKEAYRSWVTFDFADNTKLKAGDFLQYMWRLKFGKGKLAAREAFLQASILAPDW